MTLAKRELEFKITIAKTDGSPGETVTVSGHRATVAIEEYGGYSQGHAQIAIYGLPLDLMKRLTATNVVGTQVRGANRVEVLSGDDKHGLSSIFQGNIWAAWADFHDIPNVALNIDAFSSLSLQMETATGTSFKGAASVADILSAMAQKAGLVFVNDGVTGSLSNPAYKGPYLQQIQDCAHDAHIEHLIRFGVLYVWPKNGHRNIPVPVIAPGKGMVGYPTFSEQAIAVDCEFLPSVQIGGQIEIQQTDKDVDLTMVNGRWTAKLVHHKLSSQMPGGPWFTHIEAAYRAE